MERPNHLMFSSAMLLLGIMLAGVAALAGASYPSSEPGLRGDDAAAPAAPPMAPRSPAAMAPPPPPCDADRLGYRAAEHCLRGFGSGPPSGQCCAALLEAGRGDEYIGMDCFCAMMLNDDFQTVDISSAEAIDLYYQCGGRHNVTVCLD